MTVSAIENREDVSHPADERSLTPSASPPFINPDLTSTPISLLSDSHYTLMGLADAWDRKRVLRLCEFMGISRFELASLIYAPHPRFEEWFEREAFPGPVLVLLTIIESSVMEGFLFDSPVPPGESIVPISQVSEQAECREETEIPETGDSDDPPKNSQG